MQRKHVNQTTAIWIAIEKSRKQCEMCPKLTKKDTRTTSTGMNIQLTDVTLVFFFLNFERILFLALLFICLNFELVKVSLEFYWYVW